MMKRGAVVGVIIILILVIPTTVVAQQVSLKTIKIGVWNGFDYSKPASIWVETAKRFDENFGLIDLIVVQALLNGNAALTFSAPEIEFTNNTSLNENVENYLDEFDANNLKVILSIQPAKANVEELLKEVLSHYGNHSSVIGINIDIEWKWSGNINYVSNEERDSWMQIIKAEKQDFKLFLTGFWDYTHFPNDVKDLVILFDGANDTQTNILENYRLLAKHFTTVGLYTGYYTSIPPAATTESILNAAPNTEYIFHTDDTFSEKPILMFELNNIQSGWLEQTTVSLIDLHIKKNLPLICGVIPYNLTNSGAGTGVLLKQLKNLDTNFRDLFDIGQEGYAADSGELKGRSYEDQRIKINDGFKIFTSIGITPETFIPAFGEADKQTVSAAANLGFKIFVNTYENVSSNKMLILGTIIPLTEVIENVTYFKSQETVMNEIDRLAGSKAIILQYELNIFQNKSEKHIQILSELMDHLKNSGKFIFMTPRQYISYLEEFAPEPASTDFWSYYKSLFPYIVSIFGLAVIIIVYVKQRSRHINN
jgi:hypothetical protein